MLNNERREKICLYIAFERNGNNMIKKRVVSIFGSKLDYYIIMCLCLQRKLSFIFSHFSIYNHPEYSSITNVYIIFLLIKKKVFSFYEIRV